MAARRLKKAEQTIVDAAVGPVFDKALPHLRKIEAIVAEDLLPKVPPDLTPFAVKDFMNMLGNELFIQAELDQLPAD